MDSVSFGCLVQLELYNGSSTHHTAIQQVAWCRRLIQLLVCCIFIIIRRTKKTNSQRSQGARQTGVEDKTTTTTRLVCESNWRLTSEDNITPRPLESAVGRIFLLFWHYHRLSPFHLLWFSSLAHSDSASSPSMCVHSDGVWMLINYHSTRTLESGVKSSCVIWLIVIVSFINEEISSFASWTWNNNIKRERLREREEQVEVWETRLKTHSFHLKIHSLSIPSLIFVWLEIASDGFLLFPSFYSISIFLSSWIVGFTHTKEESWMTICWCSHFVFLLPSNSCFSQLNGRSRKRELGCEQEMSSVWFLEPFGSFNNYALSHES